MTIATLCFLIKDGVVLLAMKKRGFGQGRWNGVGGKVKPGESLEQTAVREAYEEIGVTININQLLKAGKLDFYFKDKPTSHHKVYIYLIKSWQGEPTESDEMSPMWHAINQLPIDAMWSGDRHWLPKVLRGEIVNGEFYFEGDDDSLSHYKLQ